MERTKNVITGDLLLWTVEGINEIFQLSDDCDGKVICYQCTLWSLERWETGDGGESQPKIGKNSIHHQYCQYYLNYLRVKNEKINYWFGCNWNPLMVFCIDMCLNKKNKYTTNQTGYQRSSVFRFIAPNSINRYHWNSEILSEKISIKWFNKCHNCVESVVLSQQQTNIDIKSKW